MPNDITVLDAFYDHVEECSFCKNDPLEFCWLGKKLFARVDSFIHGGETVKYAARRIEIIPCFCRHCWRKLEFSVEWQTMEGKTMEQIRLHLNELHRQQCKTPDVRIHAGTKSR